MTKTPHFSFGKELRGDRGRPMTPGPGQYQHKVIIGKDGPKITMSARPMTSKSEANLVPGPGQYNSVTSNRLKSPSYRIGTEKRDGFNKYMEFIPGPGQYTPDGANVAVRPKSPTWKIGTGQRPPFSETFPNPGPGNYEYTNSVGKAPKVKIKILFFSIQW